MRNLQIILMILFAGTVMAQAEILPDPTRPAAYNATVVIQALPEEIVDWKLTAIRISGADKTAIVNNRLVRVGEMIGAARIIDIQAEGVKLDYNNKQLLIRLYSETNIKKPVNNNTN